MGDFNIDVLDVGSPVTKLFADLLRSFDLVWSVDSPTRVTEHSETAIDNIITNMTDTRVTVINTAISDHHGQQITINGHEPTREPPIKNTQRETRPANIALLKHLLSQERWSFLNSEDPVEQQFQKFERTFKFHLDVSCPLKKKQRKPRHEKCTWTTKGILISREKLLFYSKIKKHTANLEFKIFFKIIGASLERSSRLQKLMM